VVIVLFNTRDHRPLFTESPRKSALGNPYAGYRIEIPHRGGRAPKGYADAKRLTQDIEVADTNTQKCISACPG
jgi:hypothetical protein